MAGGERQHPKQVRVSNGSKFAVLDAYHQDTVFNTICLTNLSQESATNHQSQLLPIPKYTFPNNMVISSFADLYGAFFESIHHIQLNDNSQ